MYKYYNFIFYIYYSYYICNNVTISLEPIYSKSFTSYKIRYNSVTLIFEFVTTVFCDSPGVNESLSQQPLHDLQ